MRLVWKRVIYQSKKAVSPAMLAHLFLGISKTRYEHSSLKTCSLPKYRGLTHGIYAVLNSVHTYNYFNSSVFFCRCDLTILGSDGLNGSHFTGLRCPPQLSLFLTPPTLQWPVKCRYSTDSDYVRLFLWIIILINQTVRQYNMDKAKDEFTWETLRNLAQRRNFLFTETELSVEAILLTTTETVNCHWRIKTVLLSIVVVMLLCLATSCPDGFDVHNGKCFRLYG